MTFTKDGVSYTDESGGDKMKRRSDGCVSNTTQ